MITDAQWSMYKKKLDEDGYAVIKGAVSAERATNSYVKRFWDYLESLNSNISREDPTTWVGRNFPFNQHGIFSHYNIGHQQFVWDARDEDGVVQIYERIWGTKDLLVSFDGACLIRQKSASGKPHVDLAPVVKTEGADGKQKLLRDFVAFQGLLNLRPCGPHDGGLVVYRGSHKHHQQFFVDKGAMTEEESEKHEVAVEPATAGSKKRKTATGAAAATAGAASSTEEAKSDQDHKYWKDYCENWYQFDEAKAVDKAFLQRFEKTKVCAEPGDFIIWDSRTVHYPVSIDSSLNTDPKAHRMCIYICMMPRSYAKKGEPRRREQYLRELRTTSHWPCINLKVNAKQPREYGGDHSYRTNFTVPDGVPVLTDRMKRLASVDLTFSFESAASATSSTKKRHRTDTDLNDTKE